LYPELHILIKAHDICSSIITAIFTKRVKIASDYDSGGMKIDTEGEFSSRIQSFFKEKQPKKIIETGTYLGNGTTSIIAASLQQFGIEDSKFYTIEVNPKYYHTALNNLRNNGLLKYVSPLNGLSVPRKILPTLKEINEQCVKNIEFDDIFVDHQENERALLYYQETNFENLKDDLLGECLKKFDYRPDFVLLDSGGHMGNIEFNYLISQLRGECYIALDDIYHIKHHKSFLQIQRDPRFELIASSKEKFGFCIAKFAPEQKNDSRQIKNILWVRTDSIGDNVLAASMLPYIRKKYESAKITAVCQKHITELYEACPFVDNIITFDRYRALQDEEYRSSIVQRLRALHADIALNSIYSREPLTDVFAIESGAKERIAFNGDLCNIPAEARARHNQFYSRLLPSGEGNKPELERHRDFLKGLGIDASSLQSIIWTTSEDEKFADDFFTSNNLQPEKTIALFAGAQREVRIYHQYGTALSQICNDNDFAVIALGSEIEHVINQESCDAIGVRTINLCGKTTLRQTAALLKRCRLAVGAETGTAHIACAVGTPNVILLGGGHFGRFIPYSPSTSIVCLPLECYGCNWHCKYQRVHCVKDILPGVITEAVRQTLEKSSEKPRVFVQGSSLWNQEAGQPKWKTFDAFLDISSVEIIPVGEILPVARAILLNSNGEDLFAKGDVESALNAFTETIEINPNFATAHNNLGVLYWQTGEVQKAVDHFARALEIDPNDRDTILNCGELFKSLEKVEDAKNIYSSYLQKNPNDKEIARALADLQVRRVIEVKDEDEKYFVSAIVSTYNSERFIRGCLEDLEAQTIADRLEIIVINSGSEQNEEAIVKEFQEKYSNIKYIRTDQRETVYAAWNRGVKASSGKYITNANADDRRRADACERMVEVLEGRPDIALVYANVIITENENETFSKCTPAGSYRWLDWNRCHLLEKGCFMGPQPMWRRNLHEEYGYFDDTLVTSGDYEFWLRVSQTNNFLHINDMLGLYLKSPDSIEHSNRKRQATENERILSMYRKAAAEGSIIRRFYSDDKIDLIRVHNRKGEELFQAGNIEGAKDIFEQILLRDPRLVEPLNNLGVIAFQQGETDQAISYFTRVLETDENYFEAIENLGKCAEVQKDYLKAAEWFERALKLKPDEIGLLNSLGNCFIQAENLSKAREVYEKSFGLDEGQENIKAILRELEGLKEAKNEAQPIHRLHRF
ncbi:MAG: tetratricopeptide repeat protein, partial [Syntrophobacterales bacterium]|nr:tetratricopeptide repeat protein [Syntrophobacterales bacterium]